MTERGVAGILVLWLLAGASSLAFGALALAKRQEARGARQVLETQALYLAYAAARLADAADFPVDARKYEFTQGSVTAVATPAGNSGILTLRLSVVVGRTAKTFETDWKRASGHWQAVSWRER